MEKTYITEKILDFKNSPYTSLFQKIMLNCSYNDVTIGDKLLIMEIPDKENELIRNHFLNIFIRWGKSENKINECIELAEEYKNCQQDQPFNPTYIHNENIYDIICWQIRSSREANEILNLLIDEKLKDHKELKQWCKGKFKDSDKIFDLIKKCYDIRGIIEHPEKIIHTTLFKKINNGITKPILNFNGEDIDVFELGKMVLDCNFIFQKMCIELGFLYSKYLVFYSERGIIFGKDNANCK